MLEDPDEDPAYLEWFDADRMPIYASPVEFMAEHGYNKDGGYTYHHCAVLKITAYPAKALDVRWPAAH